MLWHMFCFSVCIHVHVYKHIYFVLACSYMCMGKYVFVFVFICAVMSEWGHICFCVNVCIFICMGAYTFYRANIFSIFLIPGTFKWYIACCMLFFKKLINKYPTSSLSGILLKNIK